MLGFPGCGVEIMVSRTYCHSQKSYCNGVSSLVWSLLPAVMLHSIFPRCYGRPSEFQVCWPSVSSVWLLQDKLTAPFQWNTIQYPALGKELRPRSESRTTQQATKMVFALTLQKFRGHNGICKVCHFAFTTVRDTGMRLDTKLFPGCFSVLFDFPVPSFIW